MWPFKRRPCREKTDQNDPYSSVVYCFALRTLNHIISAASSWRKVEILPPLPSATTLGQFRDTVKPWEVRHSWTLLRLSTCFSEELPSALKWKQAVSGSRAAKIYRINHLRAESPPEFLEWIVSHLAKVWQALQSSAGRCLDSRNFKNHSFRTPRLRCCRQKRPLLERSLHLFARRPEVISVIHALCLSVCVCVFFSCPGGELGSVDGERQSEEAVRALSGWGERDTPKPRGERLVRVS